MKKKIINIGIITLLVSLLASCAHRDCRGNKHRVKTEMGGYL